MSRPTKLGGAGKMFSLMLRKRQHQILLNKSEELTRHRETLHRHTHGENL